jgi:hypothetical protein
MIRVVKLIYRGQYKSASCFFKNFYGLSFEYENPCFEIVTHAFLGER